MARVGRWGKYGCHINPLRARYKQNKTKQIKTGHRLQIKTVFPGMEILMLTIRRSRGRLFFNTVDPSLYWDVPQYPSMIWRILYVQRQSDRRQYYQEQIVVYSLREIKMSHCNSTLVHQREWTSSNHLFQALRARHGESFVIWRRKSDWG